MSKYETTEPDYSEYNDDDGIEPTPIPQEDLDVRYVDPSTIITAPDDYFGYKLDTAEQTAQIQRLPEAESDASDYDSRTREYLESLERTEPSEGWQKAALAPGVIDLERRDSDINALFTEHRDAVTQVIRAEQEGDKQALELHRQAIVDLLEQDPPLVELAPCGEAITLPKYLKPNMVDAQNRIRQNIAVETLTDCGIDPNDLTFDLRYCDGLVMKYPIDDETQANIVVTNIRNIIVAERGAKGTSDGGSTENPDDTTPQNQSMLTFEFRHLSWALPVVKELLKLPQEQIDQMLQDRSQLGADFADFDIEAPGQLATLNGTREIWSLTDDPERPFQAVDPTAPESTDPIDRRLALTR